MAVWSIVRVSELEAAKRLDAEYYRPEYLQADKVFRTAGALPLGDILSDVRYGIYTEPDYRAKGTDFLRALNLQEYAIEGDVLKVRPTVVPSQNYLLRPGDLLIVRSGANVGNVGIVLDRFNGATFGSYTIRLRFREGINPYFIYVFFKTKFGRLQTVRCRTGLAQPNLSIPNLKLLKVISRVPLAEQKEVEDLVRISHESILESQSRYLQAERMVLKDLEWNELDLSQRKYYSVPLSQAKAAHRLDAEHFEPRYENLVAHLRKAGKAKQLQSLLHEPIRKGITPDYDPEGDIVVVNSQNLGRYCLDFEATDRTTELCWKANSRAQISHNDVMIYATGAYIGRTNAYLETTRALAGVDILLVRPSEECNPLYLAVFLNSSVGLLQSKKFCTGSGQAHIYPDHIAQYWVSPPAEELQARVADLVQQSYEARQRAKALLEEAKRKVEAFIEGK